MFARKSRSAVSLPMVVIGGINAETIPLLTAPYTETLRTGLLMDDLYGKVHSHRDADFTQMLLQLCRHIFFQTSQRQCSGGVVWGSSCDIPRMTADSVNRPLDLTHSLKGSIRAWLPGPYGPVRRIAIARPTDIGSIS
nr:hypothetical protein [Faecalispora sporosphaeroides]